MINKKFRNDSGTLSISLTEVCRQTAQEAEKYFCRSLLYVYASKQSTEYVCIGDYDGFLEFKSFGGDTIFIPKENAGSFLPEIASCGNEMFIKFDTLNDFEKYIEDHHYFPSHVYIGSVLFTRNKCCADTCNEYYQSSFGYSFRCTNGIYIDPEECWDINTYNFQKNEYL